MQVKATSKYLRISPKKMRLVTRIVKGMDANAALDHLRFIPKRAASLISKTLQSAIANAEHNFSLKKDDLFIKEIIVNSGPTLKRWRARAFGRAASIRKRSAHLSIILEPRELISDIKSKKAKLKEPVIKSVPKQDELPAKPVSEEKIKPDKKRAFQPKDKEIFDVRRRAKRRTKQHLDRIRRKKTGGTLKQIFRRKSI